MFKESTHIQIYSREPIKEINLQADPYESEELCEKMKAMGMLFYRDNFHSEGAFFVEIPEVVSGFYFQGLLERDGKMKRAFVSGKPTKINWITKNLVNREFM